MILPFERTRGDVSRNGASDLDGIVIGVLALAVLAPCVGGALDNRIEGIAACIIEGGALLLATALCCRARWDLRRDRIVTFLQTGMNATVLSWLALVVGSYLLAPVVSAMRPYSIQELLRQASGVVVYFAVVLRFRRTEQLVRLAQTLLFVGLTAALACFWQYSRHDGSMATGLFHDHQLCGSCLAILLPVVASLAFGHWEPNRQLAAQAATTLVAIGLLLTYARSAWIGAGAGMVVWFALGMLPLVASIRRNRMADRGRGGAVMPLRNVPNHGDPGARKPELTFPLMVSLVVVGFMILLAGGNNGVSDRIATFARIAADQSWSRRLQAWRGAARMVANSPVTGHGIGSYPLLQQRYTHLSVAIDRSGGRPSLGEQAHNVYIQSAAEVGIPGMLLFAAIPMVFILKGVGRLKQLDSGPRSCLLRGTIAAMVAFAVDACASPAWQCGQVSILMWLVLGLGVSSMRSQRRNRVTADEAKPAVAPWAMRAMAAGGCVLLLPHLRTAPLSVSGTFPDHVTMEPSGLVQTVAGRPVELHLLLVNTDGSRRDVTVDPGTTFRLDPEHRGDLRCVCRRVYFTPRLTETAGVEIMGIFSGATPDVVAPKNQGTCRIRVCPDVMQGG